jgi:hypothetical protein
MSYGITALSALIGLPFANSFVPETKGVEEIGSLTVVQGRRRRG